MAVVADRIGFYSLVKLFEKVYSRKGKDKLVSIKTFFLNWRHYHNKFHRDNPTTTDSAYQVMRLLLPQCEKERGPYGIKETTLANMYISIFCLDKQGSEAQKLLNYRSPKVPKSGDGDFASVAYFFLKSRSPEDGLMNISDVNLYLDNLASGFATKNKEYMRNSLEFLIRHTSAQEQKWLIRIILKDMKLGVGVNQVLKAYHVDAVDLYNVTNSLKKVCLQLRNPSLRLHEVEIALFTPFRPMLGEQAVLDQVQKLMQNRTFAIETKYDGERVQLHKDEDKYMYFSRNGHEVTHVYGGSRFEGKLTPHIANAFKSHVRSCILDGEMLIYSSQMKCIVSKGENADVQYENPNGMYHPCFCAFDLLLINGEVKSNCPLSERVAALGETIDPIPGWIQLTEQKKGSTNDQAIAALNEAIDRREEGIVIKDLTSTYRANFRKGSGWLKVKPDYIDNLMDNLDLLIIGGYYGEGRRANKISHFLLAVSEVNADDEKRFLSVAKVGSGYSDKELDQLLLELDPYWEVYTPRKPIPRIIIGGGHKEYPEVWIEPSYSRIVEVRAAEITRSDKFATNFTLRFPRVQKIRYDKSWHQCLTLQEFEDLRKRSEGKLAKTCETASNSEPPPKKRRAAPPRAPVLLGPQFRPADVSGIEQVSELFKDKEMCVITTVRSVKQQLEKTIAQHGGKFVQNPGFGTFCIIADGLSLRVNNIIASCQYDVVKDQWLRSCVENKSLMPWVPDDMFFSTPRTTAKLREDYDEFGDGYTQPATVMSLQNVFANIPEEVWTSSILDAKGIADIEFKYFSQSSFLGLFRLCFAYIDDKTNIGDKSSEIDPNPLKWTAAKLRLHGSTVEQAISASTTHVIVHSKDSNRLKELQKLSRSRREGRFHIVTEKWVDRCLQHKNLLQEKEFMPVSK